MTEHWTCRHFSQSNPAGAGQDDVPTLLRRIADALELLGAITVHDVVFRSDGEADPPWPSVTVYFDDASESPPINDHHE